MSRTRSGAQDAAKGLMVIGVIFYHSLILTFENHVDVIATYNPLVSVFPFLLIAFFFYSGYNYHPSGRSFSQNVFRRFQQLIIPMLMAFAISAVLISSMELAFDHADVPAKFHAIGNSILYILMSEPLSWMIGFPQQGGTIFELILGLGLLWFLLALFLCSIFFYLLVDHTNKKVTTLISVVAALLILAFCLGQFVHPQLPFSLQSYPVIVAIMLTGAYLRQSNFLDREIKDKKDLVLQGINALIAEGIVVGVGLFCYFQFGSISVGSLPGGMFDVNVKGFDAFIAFGFGVIGTYFIHTLCRLIVRIPFVGNGLRWLGAHSAIFYLFHPIFLELISIVVFQKKIPWGRAQAFFFVAVAVVLLVLTCLFLDWIMQKMKKRKPAEESGPRGD